MTLVTVRRHWSPYEGAPLPNIAKSELSPKDYSTSVKIEGHSVAIRGAMFESMGDIASKGTGGGLISANTHGPAKFITPGSMTVSIEGKAVHLLGESMLNNCGPGGSPPNTGATLMGVGQGSLPMMDQPCPAGGDHAITTEERDRQKEIQDAQELRPQRVTIQFETGDPFECRGVAGGVVQRTLAEAARSGDILRFVHAASSATRSHRHRPDPANRRRRR